MADIHVEGLAKSYGRRNPVPALTDATFRVDEGEMLVLLGPSGCGKSTTLRAIAGLETPDLGEIRFGRNTVFSRSKGINIPVHRRDIGLVFQSFALWPHMSARRNIEFPLRARRIDGGRRDTAVVDISQKVDLSPDLLHKRPGQLSGGQQQRVALARALVAQPSVVLFDEPLSSLDALLRENLRMELREMHRQIGFTGVYVTHDLVEALTLGDRVAVMDAGEIGQIGSPASVFEYPQTVPIARVVGLRHLCTLERLDGRVMSGTGRVTGDLDTLPCHAGRVDMYCRPERLRVEPRGWSERQGIALSDCKVREIAYLGSRAELVVECGAKRLTVLTTLEVVEALEPDAEVTLSVDVAHVRLYDSQTGALIRGGAGS